MPPRLDGATSGSMGYVLALIGFAFLVLVGLGLVRFAWRIWRRREEPEPGGSLGDQLLGRRNRPRAK
jgi:hypothetical protein